MPLTNLHKNEVHLHGVLAKDPAIRYTSGSKTVANLTVLTKYEQYSEFHKVVAWEKLAEKVSELKKGEFVKVVGRLQTRSWDDKTSGQKKYITEIIAFQLVIPGEQEQAKAAPAAAGPATGGTAIARAILAPATPAEKNMHGQEITDDDIF